MKHKLSRFTADPDVLWPAARTAYAQDVNPEDTVPIHQALEWIQGTLMGKVATTCADIAVAAIGFGLLTTCTNRKFGTAQIVGMQAVAN